ncbi:hypothetical protein [Spirosoma arcticum]
MKQTIAFLIAVAGFATSLLAQTPNVNQAAVDTLTKDVATVVLANQTGEKAAEILNLFSTCTDGCDAVSIIKSVGGWDAVGVKMQELGRLKNTARFQAMSPGEANAAIRQELARFYAKYKTDKNYGVPLSQEIQAQMLAKIDRMLPPAVAPQSAPAAAGQPATAQPDPAAAPDGNPNIDNDALRISQLEREVKEGQANQIWMLIVSALLGLLVGAGVVYFVLNRALKKEVDRLTDDNKQLSRDLDAARRPKVANEVRRPQPDNRRKPDTYAPQQPEQGNPIRAITPVDPTPSTTEAPAAGTPPIMRSGTPAPGSSGPNEPLGQSLAAQELISVPGQPQPTAPVPARSDVFYFPPPDPNGQFDNAHRADRLSPESAYRFSSNAQAPDAATFRFEAEPGRVARFLTYRNYMIEPACDSENSFSSTYTHIVNKRDGEAVLENGVWRVKIKALIRYE